MFAPVKMIQGMKHTFIMVIFALTPFAVKAQENQNTELSKLASGNFTVYKVIENGSNFKFEGLHGKNALIYQYWSLEPARCLCPGCDHRLRGF